ncbi:hypothetical protein MRB53_037492 [Persea americana]|nr:hypothetical protein MRB53_037492 [Persea americana]
MALLLSSAVPTLHSTPLRTRHRKSQSTIPQHEPNSRHSSAIHPGRSSARRGRACQLVLGRIPEKMQGRIGRAQRNTKRPAPEPDEWIRTERVSVHVARWREAPLILFRRIASTGTTVCGCGPHHHNLSASAMASRNHPRSPSRARRASATKSRTLSMDHKEAPKSTRNKASKPTYCNNPKAYPDVAPDFPDYARALDAARNFKTQNPHQPVHDLDHDEWRSVMTEADRLVASRLNFDRRKYVLSKRQLFTAFLDHLAKKDAGGKSTWNKTAAQLKSNVDVTKISPLFEFFQAQGCFEEGSEHWRRMLRRCRRRRSSTATVASTTRSMRRAKSRRMELLDSFPVAVLFHLRSATSFLYWTSTSHTI